jgi:hypothetical protein
MAFRGRDPIRSKIVINNKIIEQIIANTYLGCLLSYEKCSKQTIKILADHRNYQSILKPSKVQKEARLQIYNTVAISTLLYGCEIWTLKEQDKSEITAAEMKFLRKTIKYTLFDHKRNQDIMKELKTQSVLEKNRQLQTQVDTTCSQNEQISTPIHCSEIQTSRKEEPRPPTEETSRLLH